MNTYGLYAIYDTAAGCFQVPFVERNDGTAQRAFATLANDPGSQIHHHAHQFVLYKVGDFSEESGKIVSPKEPLSLGNALSMRKRGESRYPGEAGPREIEEI